MNADKQISEILAKYGETFAGNVWRVQGSAVIYHKCLERIAAGAKIVYDAPVVLRAERDEAVILVTGRMGERSEWSIGEALVNVNYRVSGKQAAYVYAMAEKRAKDRVILKLIELHGLVYSEEELAERNQTTTGLEVPDDEPAASVSNAASDENVVSSEERIAADIKRRIGLCKTPQDVTDFMTQPDVARSLADLPSDQRSVVRDHAKARMIALGWKSPREAAP